MGISERALIHAVKDMAREWTGAAWDAGNQGIEPSPAPSGFVTIVSMIPIGRGERRSVCNDQDPRDIDTTMRETYSLIMQVESRGEGCFDAVASVIAGAKMAGTVRTSKESGAILGFQRAGQIRNVSVPISGRWEQRAVADLTFTVRADFTQTIPSIQSVEVVGNGYTTRIEVP